jgi:hypothetical protein
VSATALIGRLALPGFGYNLVHACIALGAIGEGEGLADG